MLQELEQGEFKIINKLFNISLFLFLTIHYFLIYKYFFNRNYMGPEVLM